LIEVAVIGVGRLGSWHARKYAALSDARLCLVVDTDAARAKAVAEELGVDWATDARAARGVQAASIASPTTTHAEIALDLLAHGVDLLIEKPLAATLEEARRIVEAAERAGRIVMVGHIERFNPALSLLPKVQPRYLEVLRIAPFPARSLDVSVVLDLMIHDLDLVLELVDAPIASIDAIGSPVLTDKIDIANARIRFANGAVANLVASRVSRKAERVLRIFAEGLYASVDLQHRRVHCLCKRAGRLQEERHQAPEDADPLRDEIAHFLHCVRTRSRPIVDAAAGVRALEAAEAVHCAIEGGAG